MPHTLLGFNHSTAKTDRNGTYDLFPLSHSNVPDDIVLKFFVINRYSIMKYLQEVRMQLRESIEMYMRYSVSYINMRNMLWTA